MFQLFSYRSIDCFDSDDEYFVELLIEYEADIEIANDFGQTALHIAAEKGKCV